MTVDDTDKFGVRSLREDFGVFENRADIGEIQRIDILAEYDAVRIADTQAGNVIFLAAERSRVVDDFAFLQRTRKRRSVKVRLAHIDKHGGNLVVSRKKPERLDGSAGFDGDFGLVDDSFIVKVLTDTADTVTGDKAFTAVTVEDSHFCVRNV